MSPGTEAAGSICGGIGFERRRIAFCWTESRRRRFWFWGTSAWYAPTWVCLGCGDRWSDGELGQRPFMRGWREQAKAKAREHWDHIPAGLSNRISFKELGLDYPALSEQGTR